jgi:pimeloyl-ACP methyl ester carboxylesterase
VGVAITAPGAFHSLWDAPVLTSVHGAPSYVGGGALRPVPNAVPENFEDVNSPAQVERINGKLLIIIGEQDENVYPASTLQFFDAAVKADKDVTLIQIPNATHGVIAGRYAVRNAWSFALEHLAGTRLPDGAVVPIPLPEPPPMPARKN